MWAQSKNIIVSATPPRKHWSQIGDRPARKHWSQIGDRPPRKHWSQIGDRPARRHWSQIGDRPLDYRATSLSWLIPLFFLSSCLPVSTLLA